MRNTTNTSARSDTSSFSKAIRSISKCSKIRDIDLTRYANDTTGQDKCHRLSTSHYTIHILRPTVVKHKITKVGIRTPDRENEQKTRRVGNEASLYRWKNGATKFGTIFIANVLHDMPKPTRLDHQRN